MKAGAKAPAFFMDRLACHAEGSVVRARDRRQWQGAIAVRIFHGALERYLRQVPVELVVESIDAKLKAKGVELSQAERGRLTAELKSGTAELIIRSGTQSDPMREVEIEWSAEDVVDLQGRSDRLVASVFALVPGLADEMAEWMLGLALKKWPSRRRRRRREMRCFQRALVNEWEEALSKLEILIDMAQEAGREALAELQKEEDDPALWSARRRLSVAGKGLPGIQRDPHFTSSRFR